MDKSQQEKDVLQGMTQSVIPMAPKKPLPYFSSGR